MTGNAPTPPVELVHALSFDIEDWFHMPDIAEMADPASWDKRHSLVEKYTNEILQICSDADKRATFFVLGWVADKFPKLVAEIADEGHEMATHSHWHRRVTSLERDEFVKDLRRSIQTIEDAGGAPVTGFRAPAFSIRPGSEWALEALLDNGITFDASLYPGVGGYPSPKNGHLFALDSGRHIPELPVSTFPLGRLSTRFSGGGYMRLMPLPMIKWGIDKLASQDQPTVVYLHPRDLDPDVPVDGLPLRRKFMNRVGTKGAKKKLTQLLADYEWSTCGEVLGPLVSS